MASWPPSLLPIAHGEPGSSGPGVEGVVGALAVDLADRVDRRQVDDVEAHRGDGVEPLRGRGRKVPLVTLPVFSSYVAPSERGKNSYQLLNSARGRSA